jgi:hypothetical protein
MRIDFAGHVQRQLAQRLIGIEHVDDVAETIVRAAQMAVDIGIEPPVEDELAVMAAGFDMEQLHDIARQRGVII